MAIAIPDNDALDEVWARLQKERQPFERVVVTMVRGPPQRALLRRGGGLGGWSQPELLAVMGVYMLMGGLILLIRVVTTR